MHTKEDPDPEEKPQQQFQFEPEERVPKDAERTEERAPKDEWAIHASPPGHSD